VRLRDSTSSLLHSKRRKSLAFTRCPFSSGLQTKRVNPKIDAPPSAALMAEVDAGEMATPVEGGGGRGYVRVNP